MKLAMIIGIIISLLFRASVSIADKLGYTNPSEFAASATAQYTLGSEIHGIDGFSIGCSYVYCKFTADTSAGQLVMITTGDSSAPFAVKPTTGVNVQIFGIACQTAVAASTCYGFVQVRGKYASASVTTGAAADKLLVPSATAGKGDAYAESAGVLNSISVPRGIILVTAASSLADVYLF